MGKGEGVAEGEDKSTWRKREKDGVERNWGDEDILILSALQLFNILILLYSTHSTRLWLKCIPYWIELCTSSLYNNYCAVYSTKYTLHHIGLLYFILIQLQLSTPHLSASSHISQNVSPCASPPSLLLLYMEDSGCVQELICDRSTTQPPRVPLDYIQPLSVNLFNRP